MNKKSLNLKVDEYTIHLHRGEEETEEWLYMLIAYERL